MKRNRRCRRWFSLTSIQSKKTTSRYGATRCRFKSKAARRRPRMPQKLRQLRRHRRRRQQWWALPLRQQQSRRTFVSADRSRTGPILHANVCAPGFLDRAISAVHSVVRIHWLENSASEDQQPRGATHSSVATRIRRTSAEITASRIVAAGIFLKRIPGRAGKNGAGQKDQSKRSGRGNGGEGI